MRYFLDMTLKYQVMKIVFTVNESARANTRATKNQNKSPKSGAVTNSHNCNSLHCETMALNRLRDGMP